MVHVNYGYPHNETVLLQNFLLHQICNMGNQNRCIQKLGYTNIANYLAFLCYASPLRFLHVQIICAGLGQAGDPCNEYSDVRI